MPDPFGEHVVAIGPRHQDREAVVGNDGAAVLGNAASDLAITAAHQHIGHRLGDAGAARDGEQMRLALGLGDLQQVGLGQAARLPQDRAGHQDIVVPGEPGDQFARRIAHRGQVTG